MADNEMFTVMRLPLLHVQYHHHWESIISTSTLSASLEVREMVPSTGREPRFHLQCVDLGEKFY